MDNKLKDRINELESQVEEFKHKFNSEKSEKDKALHELRVTFNCKKFIISKINKQNNQIKFILKSANELKYQLEKQLKALRTNEQMYMSECDQLRSRLEKYEPTEAKKKNHDPENEATKPTAEKVIREFIFFKKSLIILVKILSLIGENRWSYQDGRQSER